MLHRASAATLCEDALRPPRARPGSGRVVLCKGRNRLRLVCQVGLVVVVWLYVCRLHWENDGLWYQGDAPRHATNGLFWKDYLLSFTTDAKGYALSYYARYPVVTPVTYPPAFYLLEALAFGLLGPSPHVAKGLVLAFALMAALYTSAWLRRWLGTEAGWAGALLLVLPGVVRWSHAVMLNVPALALSAAALYHVREWLESPSESPMWRHLWVGAAFSVLAILTYLPASVLVLVLAAWVLAGRRWRLLWRRRTLAVVLVCVLVLLPWALVVLNWAPLHLRSVGPTRTSIRNAQNWLRYLDLLPKLLSPHLLVLAGVGAVAGLVSRRWRHETVVLLLWLAVCYLFFSYVSVKEPRYLLLVTVPVVSLCVLALLLLLQGVGAFVTLRPRSRGGAFAAAVVALLVVQAWLASRVSVPAVSGLKEAVAFVERVAPDEPVLYDGHHNGVFSFWVRARDPGFRRRVVRGSKLLYAAAVRPRFGLREFVSSPEEVIDALLARGGCRWLVVERGPRSEEIAAARHLRQAVRGPQFERVQSFPVFGDGVDHVDVYRVLAPVATQDEVDLPFPVLGGDVHYRVKPIER